MATQPTNPPSVTHWPDAPSRAEPSTFSDKSDAFLGHFPIGQADQNNLVTWLNSTAGQSYQNALESAASATASAASADLAQDALDNAISATNYKGAWSSLTGALNIPASVSHDDGVWLLTTNLANVAASEPAIGNANWLLIYSRATDLQVETGVAYTNPDSKQVKDFIQRDWAELTTAKTYNDSCFYRGKEYDINIPVDDVTIAPPTTAGRTFTNFDGSTQYITIPTINLIAGDVVKFKFKAPTSKVVVDSTLIDGTNTNRLAVNFSPAGSIGLSPTVTNFKIDGINTTSYPTDGLIHTIEFVTTGSVLAAISANKDFANKYKGRIYDLEVIRGGNRIHYFPLRVDAVDYLAGNLVVDEEFTNSGNFIKSANVVIANNQATFTNNTGLNYIGAINPMVTGNTYRILFEIINRTAGSVGLGTTSSNFTNTNAILSNLSANMVYDIVVVNNVSDTHVGFSENAFDFLGSIKNFRVIKLNELSPSASFSSATGFTLTGGVTITGGQAVFGSGAGTKDLRITNSIVTGKKYRFTGKLNNRTTGTLAVVFLGVSAVITITNESAFDVESTIPTSSTGFGLVTTDGWDGNVEYFSVTEVTDGTEVGSPLKTFERHWKLKSGEQLLPQNAGLVRFGVPATISASNTLEIEPLANAAKGDYIKVARTNGAEPIIKLSAADITAGRLIKYGVQTDTELTIDSDKAVILEHNGIDLEVKL